MTAAFELPTNQERRHERLPAPVHLGGWERVRLMEAPWRPGSVYGEAYRPEHARRIAAAPLDEAARLADELRIEEP